MDISQEAIPLRTLEQAQAIAAQWRYCDDGVDCQGKTVWPEGQRECEATASTYKEARAQAEVNLVQFLRFLNPTLAVKFPTQEDVAQSVALQNAMFNEQSTE